MLELGKNMKYPGPPLQFTDRDSGGFWDPKDHTDLGQRRTWRQSQERMQRPSLPVWVEWALRKSLSLFICEIGPISTLHDLEGCFRIKWGNNICEISPWYTISLWGTALVTVICISYLCIYIYTNTHTHMYAHTRTYSSVFLISCH